MNSQDDNGCILIVDDSPDSLQFLTDVVEGTGAKVLIALDGQRALDITKQVTPDVILLDAVMPAMDGFETCRQLKQNKRLLHVPVIFMTGLSDTKHIVEGFQAGGVDYLVKPIAPDELVIRMKVHLANAKLAQSAYVAMDEAHRYLLAIAGDGRVLWSTPQAARLLARFLPSANEADLRLPPHVAKWVREQTVDGAKSPSRLVLSDTEEAQILICYIGNNGPDEFLVRIIEDNFQATSARLSDTFGLTLREAEVLVWIANGKSNRDIGSILKLSPRTINKHLEHIHRKLGVENRTAAAAMTYQVM